MTRHELIQSVINKINAKSYLELGVDQRHTFSKINVEKKISVDNNSHTLPTFVMTTDNFFASNKDTFDVIFVDAYHERSQVQKDIENSLKVLNPNGVIITHDTLPLEECVIHQAICWNAWEAFAHLRKTNPNMWMASVIHGDGAGTGCGIIMHGTQELFEPESLDLSYAYYTTNRDALMNVILVDDLLAKLLPV